MKEGTVCDLRCSDYGLVNDELGGGGDAGTRLQMRITGYKCISDL